MAFLAEARAFNTDVYQVAFSPVSFVGIGTVDDLDDVTHTHHMRCAKILVFASRAPRRAQEDGPREGHARYRQTGSITAGCERVSWVGAQGGKRMTLVGNTGSFGRAAKLQDMRTFCFMPGGQVVSAQKRATSSGSSHGTWRRSFTRMTGRSSYLCGGIPRKAVQVTGPQGCWLVHISFIRNPLTNLLPSPFCISSSSGHHPERTRLQFTVWHQIRCKIQHT